MKTHRHVFLMSTAGFILSLGVTAAYLIGVRPSTKALPASADLAVPYVSQVLGGDWVLPWSQACEEASITMVDGYYARKKEISNDEARANMSKMFPWEDERFKKNDDTDADQNVELIGAQASFDATAKRLPTLTEMKTELAEGRPIIILVDMYKLYGERPQGDPYHVLVVDGYDDARGVFRVKDPARKADAYPYETVMGALGDYNPQSKAADGTPTAIFTSR